VCALHATIALCFLSLSVEIIRIQDRHRPALKAWLSKEKKKKKKKSRDEKKKKKRQEGETTQSGEKKR
jgi:hypothetical protein